MTVAMNLERIGRSGSIEGDGRKARAAAGDNSKRMKLGGALDVARCAEHAQDHRDRAHRCQHAAAQHVGVAMRRGATLAEMERGACAARAWAHAAQQAAASARASATAIDSAARLCGEANDIAKQAHAAAIEASAAADCAHRSACDAERQLSAALAAVLDQAERAQSSAQLAVSAEAVARLEARAVRAPGLLPDRATWHLSLTRLHHRATLLDVERACDAARCVQAALDVARRALHGPQDLPSLHRQALWVLAAQLERAANDAERSTRQARRASDSAARAASHAQLDLRFQQLGQQAGRENVLRLQARAS